MHPHNAQIRHAPLDKWASEGLTSMKDTLFAAFDQPAPRAAQQPAVNAALRSAIAFASPLASDRDLLRGRALPTPPDACAADPYRLRKI